MRTLLYAIGIGALSALVQGTTITCGSVLKLKNSQTGHRLHSHPVNYGSGSGQQSVTGYNGENNDANDYWSIHPAKDEDCQAGAPLKNGQKIRLQHMKTRTWLHSHLIASPISNQQEVSAYGTDTQSDTGDNWVLEVVTGSPNNEYWMKEGSVRLKHADTGAYLSNHNRQFPRPIAGQTEVFGGKGKGKESLWTATDGVYFSPETSHSESGHAGIKKEGDMGKEL